MALRHSHHAPRSQDIVIRHSSASYTVAGGSDPPRIECRTFEEALDRAGSFAAARNVDVWWASGTDEYVRLTNYPLLRRMWAEFMEMPGLGLTRSQARRLWGMDERTCEELLENLVGLEFLIRGPDGRYRRLTEGRDAKTWARMAKAEGMLPPASRSSTRSFHKKHA
jgi:hypothetical protein